MTDQLKAENAELRQKLNRIRDALCPVALGTSASTWQAIIQRQEKHTFNEYALCQQLGRKNGQTVMIVWQRYKDAITILNGKEEADEPIK